jgi:hypothetical protein
MQMTHYARKGIQQLQNLQRESESFEIWWRVKLQQNVRKPVWFMTPEICINK